MTLTDLMLATNRNLLMLVLLLLAVALSLGSSLRSYLISVVSGPRIASSAVLGQITNTNEWTPDYIKVRGMENFETGYAEYTSGSSFPLPDFSKPTAGFRLLRINDHYLVVKTADSRDKRLEYSGTVEFLPFEVRKGVKDALEQRQPDLSDKLYPFVVHADSRPQPWFAIGFGLFTLVTLWYAVQWMRRNQDILHHPLVAKLSAFGNFADLHKSLDADLSSADALRFGRTRLMPNWLLRANRLSLEAIPLSSLVWVYPKVTQHRHHGIPIGRTHAVVVHDALGDDHEFQLTQQQTATLLEVLQRSAPWAVYGFSEQIKHAWNQDQAEFLRSVQGRKALHNSNTSSR